jgi:hypothetical protein
MSRAFNFYRDENEINREEEERQKRLIEEHQYYLEQMDVLGSDDIVDESPITEEELFNDILEDERDIFDIDDDNTAFE